MEYESVPQPGGTTTITAALQKAMIRDCTREVARRNYFVTFAVVFTVVGVSIVVPATMETDWVGAAFGVALVGVVGLLYGAFRWTAQRYVRSEFPTDTEVAARVTDSTLISSNALVTQESRFLAFREVRVTKDSILFALRATVGGVAVMPRAVLDEEDIARLSAGISEAAKPVDY